MQNKKLVITGIGGFIGLRMAERAMAAGMEVCGVDVSVEAAARAQNLGINVIVTDINNRQILAQMCKSADVVFHTAAVVAEDGPRELYERVNNDGTRSIAEVAVEAGVKHFVHLSSIMVYGFNYPNRVCETGPFADDGNIYNETKFTSEKIAMSYNNPDGMGVTVIRPGDVYGLSSMPWWQRPLELITNNKFALPDFGNGLINHVHVDNLLDAVFLVLEQKPYGQAFNITDNAVAKCKDFFDWHRQAAGKKSLIKLPSFAVKLLISLQSTLERFLGKQPSASAAAVSFLTRTGKVSCDKAMQRLGYQPKISLEEGMQGILNNYKE